MKLFTQALVCRLYKMTCQLDQSVFYWLGDPVTVIAALHAIKPCLKKSFLFQHIPTP